MEYALLHKALSADDTEAAAVLVLVLMEYALLRCRPLRSRQEIPWS